MEVTKEGCAPRVAAQGIATTSTTSYASTTSHRESSLSCGARRPKEAEAVEIPATEGGRRQFPVALVLECPVAGPRKAGCNHRRYWLVAA